MTGVDVLDADPPCRCGHSRADHWSSVAGLVLIEGAECQRCMLCAIYRPAEQEQTS